LTATAECEIRCQFCDKPATHHELVGFMGQSWYCCDDHEAVPYKHCRKPADCRGACLGEIACND
jgi:hypothetical protein